MINIIRHIVNTISASGRRYSQIVPMGNNELIEWILFSELHIHVYIVQMFLFAIHNNVYIKKYAKFKGVELSLRDC